jgi:hypothetical protein
MIASSIAAPAFVLAAARPPPASLLAAAFLPPRRMVRSRRFTLGWARFGRPRAAAEYHYLGDTA